VFIGTAYGNNVMLLCLTTVNHSSYENTTVIFEFLKK